MKEKYIDLMELTLSAYSKEHIHKYFNEVKAEGLKEHGFPRLTANIGILIAHGKELDLLPIFLEMMDFCCRTIPTVKAANDFSVREILCCIKELEMAKAVDTRMINKWKRNLSTIVPEQCYNVYATSETSSVRNWALFTGISEFYRKDMGLGGNDEFIETQIASQLQWFDENGMYMDNAESNIHQPVVYDLVPRGLFTLLLDKGYNGKYLQVLDNYLKKAALQTLKMQSPNGESAFGGRSNQFLHNEAWLTTIFEYEAKRYAKQGDFKTASVFKNAAMRALAVIEKWLKKTPIRHIKNRFEAYTSYGEAGYGCESYAYFDKYMITTASFLYTAYSVCDDAIAVDILSDTEPSSYMTSEYFHKLFLKGGGYGIELDLNADPHYDASGIGRVHRDTAPSAVCLSCPCPSSATSLYHIDIDTTPFSICPAIYKNGKWKSGADSDAEHSINWHKSGKKTASASITTRFPDGDTVRWQISVGERGVTVTARGNTRIAVTLPAFFFDGEKHCTVKHSNSLLSTEYDGWSCRYRAESITDLGYTVANRNGYYKAFAAIGDKSVKVNISIVKGKTSHEKL